MQQLLMQEGYISFCVLAEMNSWAIYYLAINDRIALLASLCWQKCAASAESFVQLRVISNYNS